MRFLLFLLLLALTAGNARTGSGVRCAACFDTDPDDGHCRDLLR
jgi:hypothetical protein